MAGTGLFAKLVIVFCALNLASTALGDPSVTALTKYTFNVTCETPEQLPHVSSWLMNVSGLSNVVVPLGIPPMPACHCLFLAELEGKTIYQYLTVQPANVAGVECKPSGCEWVVSSKGFYVHDLITNQLVLGFKWATSKP